MLKGISFSLGMLLVLDLMSLIQMNWLIWVVLFILNSGLQFIWYSLQEGWKDYYEKSKQERL